MWPKRELLIAGQTREIPSGQNEPFLPAQVANQNTGFASSSRLRIKPNNLGTLSDDDGYGNENGKKLVGLDWQNNIFVRASCFLYITQPSLHDYNVKVPNFTFCRGQEHKTTIFIFFS